MYTYRENNNTIIKRHTYCVKRVSWSTIDHFDRTLTGYYNYRLSSSLFEAAESCTLFVTAYDPQRHSEK